MRTVLFLLLATALAGCAESAPPAESADAEPFDDIDLEATDETGIIRGVVVDAGILPIAGVTLSIDNLALTATTNDLGAFGFQGLDPGTYFLDASRDGYYSVQQSVQVVAGDAAPPIVRIQLQQDVDSMPVVIPDVWEGHIACGLSAAAACGLPVLNDAVGDNFINVIEVARAGMVYLQSELYWKTTQTVSPNLQLWQEALGTGGCTFAAQNAPSPNIVNTTAGDYNTHGSAKCFKTLGNTTSLRNRVFSGSIDGTFPPTENGCYPGVPGVIGGLCMGVGATIDQPFTIYNHMFYGFKPVDGWHFTAHGEPPVPS